MAKAGTAALAAAVTLSAAQSAHAGPFTASDFKSLTYDQIKGTGLANTCLSVAKGGSESIKTGGLKEMKNFCLEPTSFAVLEEKVTKKGTISEAVTSKVTTRQTYTLTGMEGPLTNDGGKLTFSEKDGIDYAPTTIQTPGGTRVPFLFTVKNLVATADKSTSEITPGFKLAGKFKVPSYRTGLFLDPKGRGTTTGYDQSVGLAALQSSGDDALYNENNKKFDVLGGNLELTVTDVNAELGEIGGTFAQAQASDTDLGSKDPKTILLKGIWYATVE